MKELKQIVVAMGAMSTSDLRDLKRKLEAESGSNSARELVINLINLYISIGDDTHERAKAAAMCLRAIDELENESSSSSSSRSSSYGSSSSSSGGGGTALAVLGLLAAGGYCAVAFFANFWPFN